MNTWWILNTYGDPLTAVRDFLHGLWVQNNLDAMLIPVYHADNTLEPCLMSDPRYLEQADPFAPLELVNAAQRVAQAARERPQARMAAVLRPCEVRALKEMAQLDSFNLDNWLIIGVDCLATFSSEDYAWRVQKAGNAERLTHKALQFARQGGIAAYRFRSACQMCVSQGSLEADLNISLLGLPVHKLVLIGTENQHLAEKLGLALLTSGQAPSLLIEQRQRMLEKIAARHDRVREHTTSNLANHMPIELNELANLLMNCARQDPPCQACLEVCPLWTELNLRSNGGLSNKLKVEQWLESCVQCGLCEDVCPKHTPLVAIINRISQTLQDRVAV
jgi:formate dehydrogenase subunit beta